MSEIEEEPEIALETLPYPDWSDEDEQRRAFLVANCFSPEIDINIQLSAFEKLLPYLKDGTIPPKDDAPSKLRRVK